MTMKTILAALQYLFTFAFLALMTIKQFECLDCTTMRLLIDNWRMAAGFGGAALVSGFAALAVSR